MYTRFVRLCSNSINLPSSSITSTYTRSLCRCDCSSSHPIDDRRKAQSRPLPPSVLANASCPRQSQVRHDELSLAQRAHHRPCLNHSVAPARTDQLSVFAVPLISRNSISRAALVKQVWTRFHPLSYTYPMAPNSIGSDSEILHVRRIRT